MSTHGLSADDGRKVGTGDASKGCSSPCEIVSDLFPPFHADTPDGERLLQVLNGQFLCFTFKSVLV